MKKTRRRFKQSTPFRYRVEAFASDMRELAERTPGPDAKERFLRRALKADNAIDVDDWLSANKERPRLLEAMLDQLSRPAGAPLAPRLPKTE
jgi:hypothetical protein